MARSGVQSNFQTYINSAEMQLLLACCKRVIGNLEPEKIQELVEAPFDSRFFLEICTRHRLILPAFKIIVKPFRERFDSEFFEAFELEVHRQTLRHIQLSKLLVDLHQEFNRRGIQHVILKGPVLGAQLFGGELLRYSVDLDFLVKLPDIMKASDCLESFGFRPKPPFQRHHFWLHKICNKDIAYIRKHPSGLIDLHWKTDLIETTLSLDDFSKRSDFSEVLFHSEKIPILSGLQNCLFLCHHAARHHWFRLRWLLDIPLLMRKENVDAQTLLRLAEDRGIRRSVEEALFLSAKLFDVEESAGPIAIPPSESGQLRERIEGAFTSKAVWKSGPVTTHHRIQLYSGIGTRLRLWGMLSLRLFMNRILKW